MTEDSEKEEEPPKPAVPKPNLDMGVPDSGPVPPELGEKAADPNVEDEAEEAIEGELLDDDEAEDEAAISGEERMWATFVHLSALLGLVLLKTGSRQPFGCLLGPLGLWALKRADLPFVDDQGREAVSFQIVVSVIGVMFWLIPWGWLSNLLLWLLIVADVLISLYAATQANVGRRFRYPIGDALRVIPQIPVDGSNDDEDEDEN